MPAANLSDMPADCLSSAAVMGGMPLARRKRSDGSLGWPWDAGAGGGLDAADAPSDTKVGIDMVFVLAPRMTILEERCLILGCDARGRQEGVILEEK